jgi:hypothetical protein
MFIESSLPTADRQRYYPPVSSPRRNPGGQELRNLVDTSAAAANRAARAWNEILDLDLDPVQVRQHLRALKTWQLSRETKKNGGHL